MEEGSSDVEIGVLAGVEEQRCGEIDGDASGCDPDDRHSSDGRGVAEAADGFPGDGTEGGEQDDGVDERREDGGAAHSVGAVRRGQTLGEHGGAQREDETQDVAEVMACVGDQRERAGELTVEKLGNHEQEVQDDADPKAQAQARRRMVVMAVMMSVTVRMRMRVSHASG